MSDQTLTSKKLKIVKKCQNCKKKLTLIDKSVNNCSSCDKKYCIRCLQPEKHMCEYSIERPTLKLEKIVTDKMQRI